jgi:hypothetical protein
LSNIQCKNTECLGIEENAPMCFGHWNLWLKGDDLGEA